MAIAKGVYEFAYRQPTHVRDQMSHQGIRADVEGHAQECVSRTLVKLTMKSAPIFNLELKQRMAWGQVNFITHARVPASHNQPPRIRVSFNFVQQPRNLINSIP